MRRRIGERTGTAQEPRADFCPRFPLLTYKGAASAACEPVVPARRINPPVRLFARRPGGGSCRLASFRRLPAVCGRGYRKALRCFRRGQLAADDARDLFMSPRIGMDSVVRKAGEVIGHEKHIRSEIDERAAVFQSRLHNGKVVGFLVPCDVGHVAAEKFHDAFPVGARADHVAEIPLRVDRRQGEKQGRAPVRAQERDNFPQDFPELGQRSIRRVCGKGRFGDLFPTIIAVISAECYRENASWRRFAQKAFEMPLFPALFQGLPVGGKIVRSDPVPFCEDGYGAPPDAAYAPVFQI